VITILQLLIFTIIIAKITYVDLKLWGTYFTPTVVLVWPFFILLIISIIYLKANFKQFELNDKVIPIWLIGLFFFWMGGLLVKLIFSNGRASGRPKTQKRPKKSCTLCSGFSCTL